MKIGLYPKYLIGRLFVKDRKSFFSAGYKLLYPEYSRHGMTPWQHYVVDGKRKGFDNGNHPSDSVFFREGYEAEYPDVKESGCDPWRHYAESGKKEGRDNGLHPNWEQFFADGYLEMYPDVAKDGFDPWHHYALKGKVSGLDNGLHPDMNLFFAAGYLAMYPDVAESRINPWIHYLMSGRKEGRDNGLHPNKDQFFAEGYLAMYPDAAKEGLDPWHHYALKGKASGLDNGLHPKEDQFFAEGYLAMYPDVAKARLDPWRHYVLYGKKDGRDNGLHPDEDTFFADGYLEMYSDVAESRINPWCHYLKYGKKEGRDNGNHPSESTFLAGGYLEMYPDVAYSDQDPWHHYVLKGKGEGRDNGNHPGEDLFSPKVYLAMYPDVAKAKVDPWTHYIQYGKKEGRIKGNSHPTVWPKAAHFYSKHILIIAELSIPQCKLYRVEQKATALGKLGYKVFVTSWTDKVKSMDLMQDCSVVIFYRVPYSGIVIDCYEEAKRLGIHTVFDIDDLVFNEDIYKQVLKNYVLSAAEKENLIVGVRLYREAMLHADENWFSTKTLCELSDDDYGTHSHCIPNCIPEELSKVADEFAWEKEHQIVNIFYGAGSSTHDRDVELVRDALEQILTENENVELTLIGDIKFGYKSIELKNKIRQVDRLDLTDYYYLISQSDIAVIPLEQNLFNTAKSNIKYIEASMFSIPSVCSDLYEFSSIIKNGENGFIARSREDWVKYIQFLIDNKNKRTAIGKAARKNVIERYSLNILDSRLSSLIEPYAISKNKKDTVLIVNILYGISSFGGATVVAERLAEEIQSNSNYEVNVFSTYTDLHDDFGTLKRYSCNNVNVWAVNVPGVNWNYTDKKIRKVFARVLNIVAPRLVHFHCIQTLGMDMCLECLEREIPYFVTIHDGWWSCARQFFVDANGRYCGDKAPSCSICKARCNIKNSEFYKKRHLAQYILGNAEKVYTPSFYFSELMQRNFPSVKMNTNKNGIIQNDRKVATLEGSAEYESSKIVLGFFGGREQVKGYFFIKECFESLGSDADNFKIIFIDTARRNGEKGLIKNDSWPLDTEVKGYTPHEKMYTLYQKIDVLLFPSMLKESFGLMVREAIYNDVFVVCSDCGGPSETIINNENGLIFPMGDKDKFRECLEFLIKNKDFIKNYRTTNFGDVRTFKEQALELLKDFDKVSSLDGAVSSENQQGSSAATSA